MLLAVTCWGNPHETVKEPFSVPLFGHQWKHARTVTSRASSCSRGSGRTSPAAPLTLSFRRPGRLVICPAPTGRAEFVI